MRVYPPLQTKVVIALIAATLVLYVLKSTLAVPLFFYLVLSSRHIITTRIHITFMTYIAAFALFCSIYLIAFQLSSCTLVLGDLSGIPAGIGTGLLFIALRYKDISLFFDETFLKSPPPIPSSVIIRSIAGVAGAAVFQEIFFRGYLLCALSEYGLCSVVISSLLFCLDHFLSWRSQKAYTKKDYIYLFLLSSVLGIIYYYTGSLIGCILGHALFNSPRIVWLVLKHKYQQ